MKVTAVTRVFEFGAREPHGGLSEFLDEIRWRNELWNELVVIDRAYRTEVATVLDTDLNQQVNTLLERLSTAKSEIKALKAKRATASLSSEQRTEQEGQSSGQKTNRNRRQLPKLTAEDSQTLKNLQDVIRELSAELTPLYPAAKKARKEKLEKRKALLDQLEQQRSARVKEAVRRSNLFWMNSEDVVKGYEQARIRAMKTGSLLKARAWTREGKITVRFSTGRPVSELFSKNLHLLVEPIDERAWSSPSRSQRRELSRTVVSLRIRTGDLRQLPNRTGPPIWAKFVAYLHRPLPEGASIRSASLIRRRVGMRFDYRLLIMVRMPDQAPVSDGRPTVSVKFGWTLGPDKSLSVAQWQDSSGNRGVLELNPSITSQFLKVDELQSIWKQYQNAALDRIKQLDKRLAPKWFSVEISTLAHWRSPRTFLHLWGVWNNQRFRGDEDAFALLSQFRERFLHLYQWQTNLRDQILRRRREQYRIFARELSEKYGKIQVEQLELARIMRIDEGQKSTNIAYWQRVASISSLQHAIANAASRNGISLELV